MSRNLSIKHRGRQMYGVFPENISMKLKTSSADHPIWDTTQIPVVHVQIQLTQCDDNVGLYCICGVAVRAGADVYVFNFCDGNSIIEYVACQQQLLDVTAKSKDNKRYKITFATGTEVSINIKYMEWNTYMDVEIRASDDDFNNTVGLCGSLNDQCDDDFTTGDGMSVQVTCPTILLTQSKTFSDSWRVSGNVTDLFNLKKGHQIALWGDHDEYCSCPSAEISDKFECSAKATVPCNRKDNYKTIRQLTCKIDTVQTLIIPNKTQSQQNQTTSNPELLNISSSEAQDLCREVIENNKAFQACTVVPNMPSDYFIQICAIEVEKSKSSVWIRHTVDSMKRRCLSEVQKNGTLSSQLSEDIQSITETVIMVICPGLPECSGNGKCDHAGACVCKEGFMSHDCSMKKTVPPDIYGVRGNSICDINETNCDTAFIVGNRIEESNELSCKLSKYTINQDGSQTFKGTTVVSGTIETLVEVQCPLKTPKQKRSIRNSIPFVEIFDIGVGYDTKTFSQLERVIVFNSKCQQINGSIAEPAFVLKEDTCFIDNQCFLNKETHPQNTNLYCNAPISPFEWTLDDGENCIIEERYFSRNDIVFGKECLFCDPDVTSYNWTLSENYCFVDGMCVKHNEKNTADECLLCNTEHNRYGWTKPDEVCTTQVSRPNNAKESSSKLGVILIGSIGSLVVLLIVGFIANSYMQHKSSLLNKKTVSSDDLYNKRRVPRSNTQN
ncbi:von Willebrand factor D and EGF domain-containing protein-like [Mytilus edulis]|uniref:von Willebrand factor D and EGF domain-containing protein-like n=1 Tax=Mytilus edulis TaxID=6550 RepID=UPI0039EDFC59